MATLLRYDGRRRRYAVIDMLARVIWRARRRRDMATAAMIPRYTGYLN